MGFHPAFKGLTYERKAQCVLIIYSCAGVYKLTWSDCSMAYIV